MQVKDGVSLFGLKPEMRKVLMWCDALIARYKVPFVVTSTTEGVHSSASLHPFGYAVDVRTRDLTLIQVNQLADQLRQRLGDRYDVVIEKTHLHIEFSYIFSVWTLNSKDGGLFENTDN